MPLQDYFRMKNIFGGGGGGNNYGDPGVGGTVNLPSRPFGQKNTPNLSDMGSDSGDAAGQYNDNSPDEVSALDQFRESVLNPPERKNPGILRAGMTGLLSALQGSENNRKPVYNAAGKVIGSKQMGAWESLGNKPFDVEEAGNILDMPNKQRLADWKLKTGGLKEAATLENNSALADQRRANASVIPKREDRLTTQGQQGLDIKKAHQTLDEWKAKNPQGKIVASKGGNFQIINPITNEAHDTGIPTGSATDEQKSRWTGAQRLEQIGAQGKNQLATEDARNKGDLAEIAARGNESRQTKVVVPGKSSIFASTTDKEDTPGQHKQRLQMRANEYIQQHPEHADFIKINPNSGMVDITPPGTNWFGGQSGPDKKTYDAMVEHMKSTPAGAGNKKPLTTTEAKNDKGAPVKQDKGKQTVGSVTDKKGSEQKTITQRSPSTGKTRTSTDGGKTWTYH